MADDPRRAQVEGHLAEVMRVLGLDESRDPELRGTPARIAEMLFELTSGACEPPDLATLEHDPSDHGLVIVRDIPFHSICAHHFLPFFGRAHIGYLPNRSLVGIGAPGRVLAHFARRPQLQERLGQQVAEFLERQISARGVVVAIEARQLCMEMRGERRMGVVETTAARGELASGDFRREFFDRISGGRHGWTTET